MSGNRAQLNEARLTPSYTGWNCSVRYQRVGFVQSEVGEALPTGYADGWRATAKLCGLALAISAKGVGDHFSHGENSFEVVPAHSTKEFILI